MLKKDALNALTHIVVIASVHKCYKISKMITTKKGDKGRSYWLNKAVDKDDLVLDVIGGLDELQAVLGVARSNIMDFELNRKVFKVQKDLMAIASVMAGYPKKIEIRIKRIENGIKVWEKELPPFTEFVIPGEYAVADLIQWARAVCRRVERSVVALSKTREVKPKVLVYLNRLSDYLFLMAQKVDN